MNIISKSKEHVTSIGESYFEHQRFAFKIAGCCFKAGFLAVIHAIIPAYFQTAASEEICRLNKDIEDRKAANN